MREASLEVADILREYGPAYLEAFGDVTSAEQRRVMHDLVRCRTAVLGGHVEECEQCGQRVIAYNSCRNRHCPKCQAAARAAWLDRQARDLLDVEYYHVIFTLPDVLGPLALQNRRCVYGLLLQAAAQTLSQVAADPQHLGADIGVLAVLHTWGQSLVLHPHVHCVVPGGGLAPDGSRWVACRPGFFLPVRVLSRVFRGKFLAWLRSAHDRGELPCHGQQAEWNDPVVFRRRLDELREVEWVVYAKAPLGGPDVVLRYLARYTHRVAISNRRLVGLEDGQVSFRWKDYAHGNQEKVMNLSAVEFIRRFLLHVLPRGFVHIRHYGLLANRNREEKLALCRALIVAGKQEAKQAGPAVQTGTIEVATSLVESEAEQLVGRRRCPVCGRGRMIVVEILPRVTQEAEEFEADRAVKPDTS